MVWHGNIQHYRDRQVHIRFRPGLRAMPMSALGQKQPLKTVWILASEWLVLGYTRHSPLSASSGCFRRKGVSQRFLEPAPIERKAALRSEARPICRADSYASEIPVVPTLRRIPKTARKSRAHGGRCRIPNRCQQG